MLTNKILTGQKKEVANLLTNFEERIREIAQLELVMNWSI